MASIRDVVLKQQKKFGEYKKQRSVISCIMRAVDTLHDPTVAARTGYVWCQEDGTENIFQAFNASVTPIAGLKVLVGVPAEKASGRKVVLGVDWAFYPDDYVNPYSGNQYIAKHAPSHEWNSDGYGVDAISVYIRMIVPFRVQIYDSTTVVALPGRYAFAGGWGQFDGEYKDFLGEFPNPNTSFKRCMVSLNTSTDALEFTYTDKYILEADVPFTTAPSGNMPLAYVLLTGTTIAESDIADARTFLSVPAMPQSHALELEHMRDIEWTYHIVNGGLIP
jgi:hypothetical protein